MQNIDYNAVASKFVKIDLRSKPAIRIKVRGDYISINRTSIWSSKAAARSAITTELSYYLRALPDAYDPNTYRKIREEMEKLKIIEYLEV